MYQQTPTVGESERQAAGQWRKRVIKTQGTPRAYDTRVGWLGRAAAHTLSEAKDENRMLEVSAGSVYFFFYLIQHIHTLLIRTNTKHSNNIDEDIVNVRTRAQQSLWLGVEKCIGVLHHRPECTLVFHRHNQYYTSSISNSQQDSSSQLYTPPHVSPPALKPLHLFLLFSPPPFPPFPADAAPASAPPAPSSFFPADPAKKAAISNDPAPPAPPCPDAAPIMLFIGFDFCLSSHSARISGSTIIACQIRPFSVQEGWGATHCYQPNKASQT